MRRFLTILLCFFTLQVFATSGYSTAESKKASLLIKSYESEFYTPAYGSYDGYVINVLTDMPLLGAQNLHGNGVNGDAGKLNAVFVLQNGNPASSVGSYHEFFFPRTSGGYLFDSTINIRPFVTFQGKPGTTFLSDANAPGSGFNMIRSDQIGNWRIFDITFTNNQSEYMNSFILCNAYPNTVNGVHLRGLKFINSWVLSAVGMGGFPGSQTDVTTWLEDLIIEDCYFANLARPGYTHINTSNDYFNGNGSQIWCGGINLLQACTNFKLRNLIFKDLTGDGIHIYGATQGQKATGKYMNGEIYNCYFRKVNMSIEANGGYGGDNLWVHHNRSYYNWYYNFSISCNRAMVDHNHTEQAEYSCIEFGGTNGNVNDNTALIRTYSGDTSTGYNHWSGTAGAGSGSAWVEGVGFNNTFTINTITLDRTGASSSTPVMYNFIKVSGMHRESSNTQDTSFEGTNNGRAAYWSFLNNKISGDITKLIDATNDPIDEVHFEGNTVISNNIGTSNTGAMISQYGNNWYNSNNIYNLTGALYNGTIIANQRTDNGTASASVSSFFNGGNTLYGSSQFGGSVYKYKLLTQVNAKPSNPAP